MNFFKSVFADDPEPPTSSDHESSPFSSNPTQPHQPTTSHGDHDDVGSQPVSNQTTPSGSWSFGGLIKTLRVKSDWIETYRRDFEEFGSGLRKETEVLREVASKAVENLPSSLEIGASKAQVSLESVGQAFDSIGLAVADMISHGKESLLAYDYDSSDGYDVSNSMMRGSNSNVQIVSTSGRYSRFDAQLHAIQCDVNTYVEEPDDVTDYNKWLSKFNLEDKNEEIEVLMKGNGNIEGTYKRVVPSYMEHDVFWSRYFYRVHRLIQAESIRAKLVKRAISTEEDEEELSWDVDDDDNGLDSNEKKNVEAEHEAIQNIRVESNVIDEPSKKLKEKVTLEGKTEEAGESSKYSNISVASTQPSIEDYDMGWDEIEDIGSEDEKKVTRSRSPVREELRKRLNAADVEEDLSWDIEDDD